MRIVSGGTAAWDAIAYGQQNPNNLQYFKNQLQSIGQTLNEQAKDFYKDIHDIYDRFTNSDAMRLMRTAMKSAASLFNDNIIRSLTDIDQFQNASYQMQRWVMANPVIRKMYHDQQCEGYIDTYIDNEPDKIADNHYDYRRVMQNVVVCDEDEGEYFKTYLEDLLPGDRELTIDEQSDIFITWENLQAMIKAKQSDPTSQYGASL